MTPALPAWDQRAGGGAHFSFYSRRGRGRGAMSGRPEDDALLKMPPLGTGIVVHREKN
jgi:hypothetical protein